VRIDHGEMLGREVARVMREYSERITQANRQQREKLPDEVITEIEGFAASLSERAGYQLAELATELMGDLEADPSLGSALNRVSTAALGDGAIVLEAPERQTLTKVDKLSSLVSFSSGRAIGSFAATMPLVAGFALPVVGVGLGVGAAFSVLMTKGRRDIVDQQSLRTWVQNQLNEAQRQIAAEFARRMLEVQDRLHAALVSYIEQRQAEVGASIAEYQRTLEQGRSAGAAGRQAAEQALGRIRSLANEAEALLAILGSARPVGIRR
jgi:hypothetical protein